MSILLLKHSEITGNIIGVGMEVHRNFGFGFPEIVYKRALCIEFDLRNIQYQQEVEKPIYYKGKKIYSRKLDLLVEGCVLIEIKAVKELDNDSINQILNYMKVFNIEVGLLMNFGQKSFYFKRFVL